MNRTTNSLQALLCVGILAFAQRTVMAANLPSVTSAVIDWTTNQITITGANLAPAWGSPVVKLDGIQLALVNYNSTSVLANMPSVPFAWTYRLTVDTGSAVGNL